MRTSGARFPDPPEGDDEPKRYRVAVVTVTTLFFEVVAFDSEGAEAEARAAYKRGESPVSQNLPYIDDINAEEVES